MKKTYETPNIEVVKFQYRDQVVVASGGGVCIVQREAMSQTSCNPNSNPELTRDPKN